MYVKNSRSGETGYSNEYRMIIFTIDITKNKMENVEIALTCVGFFTENFERSLTIKNWWWANAPTRIKNDDNPAILEVRMLDIKSKIVGIVTESFLFVVMIIAKYARIILSMWIEFCINTGYAVASQRNATRRATYCIEYKQKWIEYSQQ